jgi:hypothetical protein
VERLAAIVGGRFFRGRGGSGFRPLGEKVVLVGGLENDGSSLIVSQLIGESARFSRPSAPMLRCILQDGRHPRFSPSATSNAELLLQKS